MTVTRVLTKDKIKKHYDAGVHNVGVSDVIEHKRVLDEYGVEIDATASGASTLLTAGTISGDDTPTLNAPAGKIVSAITATAAGAIKTITLTNSFMTAASIVIATLGNSAGDGTPLLYQVTPASGTCVFLILNDHATEALTTALTIDFAIVG